MKKLSIASVFALIFILVSTTFLFLGCKNETEYGLTVNGSEYLYEDLNDTYKAGENVSVKVKITPYEGVKVLLNAESLVKSKSSQDEFWLFTFEMPARDATLEIRTFEGFDEPLLYGFHLTFEKDGNPIEEFDKPFNSEEAIASYFITYYDEEIKKEVFSDNTGANVFTDGKIYNSNVKIEREDTLYFTYELIGAVGCVNWVYFDENQGLFTETSVGYRLDERGISSSFKSQNLSDTRCNSQMKEYEKKFESNVKIIFKYLDYLTGVKVLEYSAANELIKSTEIAKSDEKISYTVSENCEYVVIEEEYTVMNDETQKDKTYCERTLINKSEHGGGKFLKYPRGNGLILPVSLSIRWQTATDE